MAGKRNAGAAKPIVVGHERINPDLNPLVRPIGGLRHDPSNARRRTARNVAAITFALERFGQQKPVVATRDGTVVAGNGVLQVALSLGWKRLAVVFMDSDDPTEARAYALADNRAGELSEWDFGQLGVTLAGLDGFPLTELGWDAGELEPLLASEWGDEDAEDEDADGGMGGDEGEDGETDEGEESVTALYRITLTPGQAEVFQRAAAKLRGSVSREAMGDGRVVELLAKGAIS